MKGIKPPYWEGQSAMRGSTLRTCDACGCEQKPGDHFKIQFTPVSWFRGDDELTKTLCNRCYKDMKSAEAEKKP